MTDNFIETYTLLEPVENLNDGSILTQVKLQKPKVKHFKEAGKYNDEMSKSVSIIAQITGLSIPQVQEFSMLDLEAILEILAPFISRTLVK